MSAFDCAGISELRRICEGKHALDKALQAVGQGSSPIIRIDRSTTFAHLAKVARAEITNAHDEDGEPYMMFVHDHLMFTFRVRG